MSLKASVGFHQGVDAYTVGANAYQDALNTLDDTSADVGIVFASVEYDQQKMLNGIRSVCGTTVIVGASTAGEITTLGPLNKHSVAVMLLKSDRMRFFAGVGNDIAHGARSAGKAVADAVKAKAGEPLKTFMMFPDILAGNGADIVRGVQDSLGAHFPIVGGAAGDDFKFEKTYQYLDGIAYSGSVVGLGITGDFKFGIGVKHGWIPIGMPRVVTKSSGSVLHELDGKPAIDIYDTYFGKEESAQLRTKTLAKLAITYPLGMHVEGSDEMLIRDPITVDEHGSITCAAEIPVGAEIQLMIGSREEAIVVAKEAAQNALAQLEGSPPKAVIIFNCIARNKIFGERSGEEISAIQEVIGADVPLIGFYTYGEQAPLGGEVRNIEQCKTAFHNETVVICVLAE
jgi:hypothetical protein